jgi:hypothetical protein
MPRTLATRGCRCRSTGVYYHCHDEYTGRGVCTRCGEITAPEVYAGYRARVELPHGRDQLRDIWQDIEWLLEDGGRLTQHDRDRLADLYRRRAELLAEYPELR